MRVYLVDGTNAARRGAYDPRFPELEERRSRELVERLSALAGPLNGRVAIEVVFDGPRRDVGRAEAPVSLRFSGERPADDLILGTVRALKARGKGSVVATADGGLRREAADEGARVIGYGELWERLMNGRA